MDYKRVLKLHFENGYSGRAIAKNTGEGQRTAVNDFLKRFKECKDELAAIGGGDKRIHRGSSLQEEGEH